MNADHWDLVVGFGRHHGAAGLAIVLALLAAVLFAVASVAQQRAARTVPDDDLGGLRLIRALIRHPSWWVGTLSDLGAYLAQAAALGFGSLLLVQPLLVTTLLVALPLGARWAGRRLRRADWTWAVLLVVALAAFVVVGEPTAGRDRASPAHWLPAGVVVAVVLVCCLVGSSRYRGARAALLAVATAVAYGLTAALTKGVVDLLARGPVAVATHWETYGLVLAAVGGTLLQQNAFQAGDLAASLPIVTAGEPVVAVALGVAVLDEHLRVRGAEWLLIGVLVAVVVLATVALSRSAVDVPRPEVDARR
ncbi:DMT family transporter [Umezawaea sp. Da 62-37]|uniref:DMT family transporter n=1 Tax=Umezawaea sp. Da 62-37 TaxID=3075927 RepID=UPI0028F6F680|nr:DMT family transporter [Umezawaea sp. Da 62-37]WNV86041.1 DMT family transporter [Umezawaea sp. Da 62-37]